jgi:hypothetical protein
LLPPPRILSISPKVGEVSVSTPVVMGLSVVKAVALGVTVLREH